MQYFFIPGRFSTLSLAELKSVVKLTADKAITIDASHDEYFLLRTTLPEEEIKTVFDRLGGFIKFGRLVEMSDPLFLSGLLENRPKKHAVSIYGSWERGEARKYATALNNQLKKYFADNGVKTRFVGAGESEVSTGSIVGTKLL